MDLILWRHAEAVEALESTMDSDRKLTPRGEKQAARVAAWLDRQLPDGARVWASPTRRTQQTAEALRRKFKTSELLGPQASTEQMLALVQWPHGKGCAVVVGHQPTLGQAVVHALGLPVTDFPVKKGALWWLRHRAREAGGQTVVLTVQSPEFL